MTFLSSKETCFGKNSTKKQTKRTRHILCEHSSAFTACSPYHGDKGSKGARGMPWRQVPKKDVVHCDKHWSVVCRREQPVISEWGNPVREERIIARARGTR